jgi:hypothetical protein
MVYTGICTPVLRISFLTVTVRATRLFTYKLSVGRNSSVVDEDVNTPDLGLDPLESFLNV